MEIYSRHRRRRRRRRWRKGKSTFAGARGNPAAWGESAPREYRSRPRLETRIRRKKEIKEGGIHDEYTYPWNVDTCLKAIPGRSSTDVWRARQRSKPLSRRGRRTGLAINNGQIKKKKKGNGVGCWRYPTDRNLDILAQSYLILSVFDIIERGGQPSDAWFERIFTNRYARYRTTCRQIFMKIRTLRLFYAWLSSTHSVEFFIPSTNVCNVDRPILLSLLCLVVTKKLSTRSRNVNIKWLKERCEKDNTKKEVSRIRKANINKWIINKRKNDIR